GSSRPRRGSEPGRWCRERSFSGGRRADRLIHRLQGDTPDRRLQNAIQRHQVDGFRMKLHDTVLPQVEQDLVAVPQTEGLANLIRKSDLAFVGDGKGRHGTSSFPSRKVGSFRRDVKGDVGCSSRWAGAWSLLGRTAAPASWLRPLVLPAGSGGSLRSRLPQ